MNVTDWTGAIGVTILLVAFILNLTNRLGKESLGYIVLNILGAGIACLASILLHYWPFIILEGSWTLVSLVGLISYFRKKD